MFNREKALQFAEDTLNVHNTRNRMKSDPRGVLNDIITAWQKRLPFTNVGLMSIERDDRRRPTLEEIKLDVLSGIGGLCYTLNVANFSLLRALGFDVVLALAAIPLRRTHVIVYVRNVERPGDTFLADVGLGFPTFRAVPADLDETPVFRDSFLEYKYMKRDGKLLRLHRGGDQGGSSGTHEFLDGWRVVYSAELCGTANIGDLDWNFDQVFTHRLQAQDPLITQFHSVIRIVQFPNKRAVILSNHKLLVENKNGELEKTELDGDQGILSAVKQYFPAIPQHMVEQALLSWGNEQRAAKLHS